MFYINIIVNDYSMKNNGGKVFKHQLINHLFS